MVDEVVDPEAVELTDDEKMALYLEQMENEANHASTLAARGNDVGLNAYQQDKVAQLTSG